MEASNGSCPVGPSHAAMQAPQSPNLTVPIPVHPIFGFPQSVGTKRGKWKLHCLACSCFGTSNKTNIHSTA